MPSFLNIQGISVIEMHCKMRGFCPLGDDYYTNQFKVTFKPGTQIPDYCDVENFLLANEKLIYHKEFNPHGKKLIIEDSVDLLYEHLQQYKPLFLRVESYVDDAAHFPVLVVKE